MGRFGPPVEIIRTDRKRSASIHPDGESVQARAPQSLSDHRIINYVVAPELRRILAYSHSRQYWRDMERVMPDYRDLRRPLKERGARRLEI